MPQLLNPPESSLSKAHKRVTKQLLKQYANEGMSADTATGAADVQEVIDVLDEAINLSEVLLNDADDTAFKNASTSTANRANSIPTSSITDISKLARSAQARLGQFDAKNISAVSNSNIEARLENLQTLIDSINTVIVLPKVGVSKSQKRAGTAAAAAVKKLSEIVSFVQNKLRAANKLTGGSLSNSFAF